MIRAYINQRNIRKKYEVVSSQYLAFKAKNFRCLRENYEKFNVDANALLSECNTVLLDQNAIVPYKLEAQRFSKCIHHMMRRVSEYSEYDEK